MSASERGRVRKREREKESDCIRERESVLLRELE